jgi:hypothetical protein
MLWTPSTAACPGKFKVDWCFWCWQRLLRRTGDVLCSSCDTNCSTFTSHETPIAAVATSIVVQATYIACSTADMQCWRGPSDRSTGEVDLGFNIALVGRPHPRDFFHRKVRFTDSDRHKQISSHHRPLCPLEARRPCFEEAEILQHFITLLQT